MFTVIQFPIADGRLFVMPRDLEGVQPSRDRLRLRRPDFSNLQWSPPPEFLRYFGRAIERKFGKQSAWFDERAYCRANRAIRFDELHLHPLQADSVILPAAVAFRRIFGDGVAVSRVEIGIRAPSSGDVTGLTGLQCKDIVASFIQLPTKVRAISDSPVKGPVYQAPAALARQGNGLTKLFTRATTLASTPEELAAQSRLVKGGLPLVIAEFGADEAVQLPADAFSVDPAAVGGAELGFAYVPFGRDDRIPTWFLKPGTADDEQLRNLRLVLLRLHAQRQVLNLILNQVLQSFITFRQGTEAGDRLESYLNAAMTIVQKPGSFGVSQVELWKAINDAEAAEAALGLASQTIELAQGSIDREHLLARLTTAKGQLQRRVGEYASSTRPATPVDISAKLMALLSQLSVTAGESGRTSLLASIPGHAAFNRDPAGNQLHDLDLIVDQVIAIGTLASGVNPLVTLIDNALQYAAPGSELQVELQSIRDAHASI
jgi:hypothetical protein